VPAGHGGVGEALAVGVGDCEGGGKKCTVVVIATTEVIADEPVLYV
jgi:hypothetical protein